jgi:outer membrane immunogenic protein
MHGISYAGLATVALITVCVAGGRVDAADMPLKAPPPAVAVASWTGPYLGVDVGMRSTRTDATTTSCGGANIPAGGCTSQNLPASSLATTAPFDATAFRLGGYLGYNWQVAPKWVVGIEGDIGSADKTAAIGGMINPGQGFGAALDSLAVKTTWDASARGRVGYLVTPSFLLYATGGAAWLHFEATSNCGPGPFNGFFFLTACNPGMLVPNTLSHSTTAVGWTIGGGGEIMLWNNWFARAEYRYADFGTASYSDNRVAPLFGQAATYDVHVRTHTALFGLAYKFDLGAPVAASAAGIALVSAYKAPPPVPVASWSGVYVGLDVGVRGTRTDATTTSCGPTGICLTPFAQPIGTLATSAPVDSTAFRFGGYLGYNWQVAPRWLVGVEGDVGSANKTSTIAGFRYPGVGTGSVDDFFAVRTTWDASARGRFGYLVAPSLLVYATGGAAWLHFASTSNCGVPGGATFNVCELQPGPAPPPVFGPNALSHATTAAGWTIGGGIETMLWSNWFARGEYRYADFGTASFSDTRVAPPAGGGPITLPVSYDVHVRTHTALFGLAYKFDWGGPAIAQR